MNKPTVFICANAKQFLAAKVAGFSLKQRSNTPDKFDVVVINQDDFAFLSETHGRRYLRQGRGAVWDGSDQQAFTPLRFHVPELMGYQGRALVIDPDIFAVGDVMQLLARDMEGKALMCRSRPGKGSRPTYLASSVMLLDCASLTHWNCPRDFEELFSFKRDYSDWMRLRLEPTENVGLFEDEWNHFDVLNEQTKLLHNTNRRTQPWKTGLPMTYAQHKTSALAMIIVRLRQGLESLTGMERRHQRHPDAKQEEYFFQLLAEAIQAGAITRDLVERDVANGLLRADTLELLAKRRSLLSSPEQVENVPQSIATGSL